MKNFITRVELHDAVGSDYDKLHAAMELRGFRRTIIGSDGQIYQLPTAQYWFASDDLNLTGVHQKAINAANTVGKRHDEITTEGYSQFTLQVASETVSS